MLFTLHLKDKKGEPCCLQIPYSYQLSHFLNFMIFTFWRNSQKIDSQKKGEHKQYTDIRYSNH